MSENIFRRRLSPFQAFLVLVAGFLILGVAFNGVIFWIERTNPPAPFQGPAQLGKRTYEILHEIERQHPQQPRTPEDELFSSGTPEEILAYLFRRSTTPTAQVRIQRRDFGSVELFVTKSRWEDVPYPDRRVFLESMAQAWCTRVESSLLTTVTVRDIRSGDELASCHCPSRN